METTASLAARPLPLLGTVEPRAGGRFSSLDALSARRITIATRTSLPGRPWHGSCRVRAEVPADASGGSSGSVAESSQSVRSSGNERSALAERNERLMRMQKELLDQLEERRKLHAALLQSLDTPAATIKAFNESDRGGLPPVSRQDLQPASPARLARPPPASPPSLPPRAAPAPVAPTATASARAPPASPKPAPVASPTPAAVASSKALSLPVKAPSSSTPLRPPVARTSPAAKPATSPVAIPSRMPPPVSPPASTPPPPAARPSPSPVAAGPPAATKPRATPAASPSSPATRPPPRSPAPTPNQPAAPSAPSLPPFVSAVTAARAAPKVAAPAAPLAVPKPRPSAPPIALPRAAPPPPKPVAPPAPAAVTPSAPPAEVKAEPLAGPNVMNVVMVASECAPWSKTGGLGDVVGALPKALARRGHRVMVVVPRYGNYEGLESTNVRKRFNVAGQDMEVLYQHKYVDGVDFVFIDHNWFHHLNQNIYGGSREVSCYHPPRTSPLLVLRHAFLAAPGGTSLVCARPFPLLPCVLTAIPSLSMTPSPLATLTSLHVWLQAPWHVPCGGVCYGDGNLVFVANDWHTALLPVYLQGYYRDHGMMEFTRSVLVIHNMAHQGRGPVAEFPWLGLPEHYIERFRLYDPVGGEHMNIFMAGIISAQRLVAVSRGYAWEVQTQMGGWGLDGVLREHAGKLRGVVNGIDTVEWGPESDVHLVDDNDGRYGYMHYNIDTLEEGKAACKAALQRELGLPVRADVPLLGFIGRLDYQKGVDIIAEAMPWLTQQDVQLVMLGTGREDLENVLREMEGKHKDKVRGWVGFSVKMAHRITAGCDILLMPSRFEPCGLNQLYAMRYGTVPVVHAVGGLRDTVTAFDPFNDSGLGWTFDHAEVGGLVHALGNAIYTYRDYRDSWRRLQRRGMAQDLSWDAAAVQYEEILVEAKYTW
ncbi:unnamed protein product [Closterium sp. Naga37s-1]|nr:unnamed protein product [Closterium sp. Naga37s-1]